MPKQEPSGEDPDVNVSGSQGVVIGSGIQYNTWAQKPPPDPADLRDLNPHIAVVRLQQLSHDELVNFFARASPDDVSEILEAFLDVDLSKIVAALGDINRRKAIELIGPRGRNLFLQDLPQAAEAIARKAGSLGWTGAEPLAAFLEGYARRYNNGHVFWSPSSGVARTTGSIDDYWAKGGTEWGFPVEDQETAPTSPFGAGGVRQKFAKGAVYSSEHGVYRVIEDKCHEDEGGSGGWLGFPYETAEVRTESTRQFFEGGIICSSRYGVFPVRSAIVEIPADDVGGKLFPIDREVDAVRSPQGTMGSLQRFDDIDYHNPLVVYSSETHGSHAIQGRVIPIYDRLGGTGGWLGFPIAESIADRSDMDRGWTQAFEGGTVYELDVACFAVSCEITNFIAEARADQQLGWPTSEEASAGTGDGDRIQFFEHGVVTRRDGKYEVWVSPDSNPKLPVKPG